MKLFKTKFSALALTLFAVIAVAGCTKPDKGNDPAPIPNPDNAIVMPKGHAIYFGSEPGTPSTLFAVTLFQQDLTFNEESLKFSGSGDMLWLELNATRPANDGKPVIATGSYSITSPVAAAFPAFTFKKGVRNTEGQIDGSFFASVVNGVETEDLIVDGSIYVSKVGERYTIIVQVTSASGKSLVYRFDDMMKFLNYVATPPVAFDGTFTAGDLRYFGDFYKVKYGNYLLELSTLPRDGSSLGGHLLGLDINAALATSQKGISINAGTYQISYDKTFNKPMTFNSGWSEIQDVIYGSFWVQYNSQGGVHSLETVEDGEFTVSDLGAGKFKVEVTVELSDGTEHTGVFEGELAIIDGTCLSRMEGDVTLDKFTQGVMVFRGEMEYTMTEAYNWAVMLATDGIDLEKVEGTGSAIVFDINTPRANTKELPEGTFSVIKKLDNAELLPFTYVPGYYDDVRQQPKGSWYRDNLAYTAPAVSGTITITKIAGGNGYDIEYNLRDDYHYVNGGFGNQIKGSYSGELSYIDATIVPEVIASKGGFAPMVSNKRPVFHGIAR